MITRRRFVESGVASLAALAGLAPFIERLSAAETFEVVHTDAEWRKLLTPDQYTPCFDRKPRSVRSAAR